MDDLAPSGLGGRLPCRQSTLSQSILGIAQNMLAADSKMAGIGLSGSRVYGRRSSLLTVFFAGFIFWDLGRGKWIVGVFKRLPSPLAKPVGDIPPAKVDQTPTPVGITDFRKSMRSVRHKTRRITDGLHRGHKQHRTVTTHANTPTHQRKISVFQLFIRAQRSRRKAP